MRDTKDGRARCCFSPPDFHAAIFFVFFFSRHARRLSERGTTRSLKTVLLIELWVQFFRFFFSLRNFIYRINTNTTQSVSIILTDILTPYRIFSIKRRTPIKRRLRKKTPGQNCQFLFKRRGRLIGVPSFIRGRGRTHRLPGYK